MERWLPDLFVNRLGCACPPFANKRYHLFRLGRECAGILGLDDIDSLVREAIDAYDERGKAELDGLSVLVGRRGDALCRRVGRPGVHVGRECLAYSRERRGDERNGDQAGKRCKLWWRRRLRGHRDRGRFSLGRHGGRKVKSEKNLAPSP